MRINRLTDGQTHDGHNDMTIARWPSNEKIKDEAVFPPLHKIITTINFSRVFYPFGELSSIFIKSKIVVCKPLEFGRV